MHIFGTHFIITHNGGGLRPPPQRWAAASRRPTFVDSIVGDGEAANIANTYADTYQMCPYFYILLLTIILQAVRVCRRPPGEIRPQKLNLGFPITHFAPKTGLKRRAP